MAPRTAKPNSDNPETLIGDVRDLVLQEMRDAKDGLPWTLRNEKDQQLMIERADRFAHTLVANVVERIAASGLKSLPVQIGKCILGDAVEIKLIMARNLKNVMALEEAGKAGFLVLADPEQFAGERAPIRATPDQRRLLQEDSNPGEAPKPRRRKDDDDGPTFDNTDAGR